MVKSLGITGTSGAVTDAQIAALRVELRSLRPSRVHHGLCVGADELVHWLVRELLPDARIIGHPPDNPKARVWIECDELREELPYLVRNQGIVNESRMLLGVPAGSERTRSGTWATIRRARKAGLPIRLVLPSGEVVHE